jgi:chromosome segregation protein
MLKRLELLGFKSFAEKTRFDFPPGVTAIVGPNGSGKSNVVDAVRWVLGEQSAKSLRGGEMTDVIFNGSSTRKSLGLAEVSLTFDNRPRQTEDGGQRTEDSENKEAPPDETAGASSSSPSSVLRPLSSASPVTFLGNHRGPLNIDADEVVITRRVYRDGQGEYLINNRPCRLKDIKDLFLGSGAGSNAYSIIEQGRVDALLQASTKDRRVIFEEAAGISRFKARKTEALRRLDRVEQNLQRLRDILAEVDKQLRSVRLQASKAQRFQEYSARLKELRVGLGVREFRELTGRWDAERGRRDELRAGLSEATERAAAWEEEARRREAAVAGLESALRDGESRLADARQRIAADQATAGHERARGEGLEADLARARRQQAELARFLGQLGEAAAAAERELAGVAAQEEGQRQRVEELTEQARAATEQLAQLRQQVLADQAEQMDRLGQEVQAKNDAIFARNLLEKLYGERERKRARSAQASEHLATIDLELDALTRAESELQGRLADARQEQHAHTAERDELRRRAEEAQQVLADRRARHTGLISRIEVLEGLERSREGLNAGVREVCSLLDGLNALDSAGTANSPWRTVRGLVADLLTVPHEVAPLIDLALGEAAQCFLVRDAGALDRALEGRSFAGRVGFLPFTPTDSGDWSPGEPPPLAQRADRLVRCESPELAGLPGRLLGRTLIVSDLAIARRIAAQSPGWRFVTRRGELLESDGTLTVGGAHAEAGLLSRKSELRELRREAAAAQEAIDEAERGWLALRAAADDLEGPLRALGQEIALLSDRAGDLRLRIGQHRHRHAALNEEVALNRNELDGLEQDIARLEGDWARANTRAGEAEGAVRTLQERMDAGAEAIRECELRRTRLDQEHTAAQVSLAQLAERLAGLRRRFEQSAQELAQRRQEAEGVAAQVAAAERRLAASGQALLDATARLAVHYLDKESAERQLRDQSAKRDEERARRQELQDRLQQVRSAWQSRQEEAHALDLCVRDLEHHRTALADRIREDYGIELAEIVPEDSPQRAQRTQREDNQEESNDPSSPSSSELSAPSAVNLFDPAAAEQEIAELRTKLSKLGSVNLESLQELTETETRASALQAQFDDLTSAQKSLQEIIGSINQDSRRLFTETFAAIRAHFQELFRKLFGGGMADVVLEDESDVLECGIEINARPPGKELRSISLMSGGEKTLTAVALLLAIFRSKPSPFCLLDEVDAALDEANTARLAAVLREFMERSQFIVVTHHKRTMASADVLYGVTMQESGVSRQVAVRFEDWPDEEQQTAA